MEKGKNIILAQAFMLLCAFALPFISVYCQEYAKPRPKRTLVRKRVIRKRPTQAIPVIKPIEEPIHSMEETEPSETVEPTENSEEEAETTTTPGTKQTQAAPEVPNTWQNIYKTFAIVVLNSLYKGSETGIAALTKIVIKRFVERRDTLAARQELEVTKKEVTQELEKNLSQLPTEQEQRTYIQKQQPLLEAIQNTEDELEKKEKQTSLSAIAATGVYMGMLNTAVPMMGVIMGTAVKIALQMLMPVEPS